MKEKVPVLGKKFGKLTPYEKVLRRTPKGKSEIYYKCRCDCGNELIVNKRALTDGIKTDCGCGKEYKHIGEKHGKLTVKERVEVRNGYYKYRCKCDCGNEIILRADEFVNGGKTSCGCDKKDERKAFGNDERKAFGNWEVLCKDTVTEGQTKANPRYWCRCIKCGSVKTIPRQSLNPSSLSSCKTCKDNKMKYPKHGSRIRRIWQNMKRRCKGKGGQNTIRYYAGRGIRYQPSWEKFENFYDDMKEGYVDNLQLDRIDHNGDYTKENCRWVTAKENCRNRRDNSFVTAGGETHVQAWWKEKYGVSNTDSLRRCLQRDYGDDWEIKLGHRQNWLDTPRYHV